METKERWLKISWFYVLVTFVFILIVRAGMAVPRYDVLIETLGLTAATVIVCAFTFLFVLILPIVSVQYYINAEGKRGRKK